MDRNALYFSFRLRRECYDFSIPIETISQTVPSRCGGSWEAGIAKVSLMKHYTDVIIDCEEETATDHEHMLSHWIRVIEK
jgi:hypothetical protein